METINHFNDVTTEQQALGDEWNDSLQGEYLWSNVNFGEAVTEVMTPFSWTVLKKVFGEFVILPGYDSVGNIGGRPYLNISLFASLFRAIGRSQQDLLDYQAGTLYMKLPEGMQIPVIDSPVADHLTPDSSGFESRSKILKQRLSFTRFGGARFGLMSPPGFGASWAVSIPPRRSR